MSRHFQFTPTLKTLGIVGALSVLMASAATGQTASDCSADSLITAEEADNYVSQLWQEYSAAELDARRKENDGREMTIGEHTMPFWYKVFGEKPEGGRSLFISMHGGGGGPARMNDGQYRNQKKLYEPAEGVYFVPRAPTNTWNMWHRDHIDDFFQRVIENMVLLEGVNPNRVYIMGYSAGGDGVFQLAPRLADRLAAAAMMAGHPNETTPEGLRNLPFTIHMGEEDSAFKRNEVAAQWKTKLSELHEKDPDGYVNEVTIHKGLGHWVNRKDAVAVPWMARFSRSTLPDYVVWKQDDRTHNRFYWLAVSDEHKRARLLIRVRRKRQVFEIEQCDVSELLIRVNDEMIDFGKPVVVKYTDAVLFDGTVSRSKATIKKTFEERFDKDLVFSAEIKVKIPKR